MPVDKLTIEQFAQKVKAKYPQYKDVTDSDLVDKMVAKYPEYKDKINYTSIAPTQQKPEPQQSAFKPATDWLNIPQGYQPIVPENQVNEHTAKVSESSTRVKAHLTDIDKSIHNLIYEKKKDIAGRIKSEELGVQPKETGPVNFQVQQLAQKEKQDEYVSPIEVESFKQGMNENPVMLRQGLAQKANDLIKSDPEQANLLKGDIYRLDRQNDPQKEKKVSQNIDKINKGELDYDVVNGRLIKPIGFFEGIVEGFKEKNKSFGDYDIYSNANEADIIKHLNKRISQDPDEPTVVSKEGFAHLLPSGEGGMMIGGQPLKPLAGGALAGYFGGPHAGAAAMGLISAPEIYKLGYANALPQNYAAIKRKNPEISDADAYHQASELSDKQANIDAATGMAMGLLGGEFAFKPTGLSTGLLQKSVGSALKQVGEEGAKKAFEGLGVGAIGATGQLVKNLMAKKEGLLSDESAGIADQLKGGVAMTLGMTLAAKSANLLKPSTYNKLFQGLSKLPPEAVSKELDNLQNIGHITPEEAQRVQAAIDEHKKLDAQIPDNIPESDRLKVQSKIKERNDLEAKLETVHKAYHPEIKEQIKKLDEEIVNISKGSERGELQKLIDESKIEGSTKKYLQGLDEKELKRDAFKEIAEQVHDPESANQAIETFGKEIVDKAKELYPKEEPKQSSISVIQPGEIKHPETITIKPQDNAETIRSNQSEVSGEGNVGGQRPNARSENIQQPEIEPPINGETEQQAGGGAAKEKSAPIGEEKIGSPSEIGITHRQMDAMAEELGLPTYEKSPEKVSEWDQQAAQKLQQPEALNDLFKKLRDGILPDHVETRMMLQYMGDLKAKIEKDPYNRTLQDQFLRTKDIFNIAGRLQGKGLAARKGSIPVEETLPDFIMRDREANQAPLTDDQITVSKKEYEDIKAANDAYAEKLEQEKQKSIKSKAEQKIKEEAKAAKKQPKKDYTSDRAKIYDDIKEKLRKVRGDTNVVIVPYAKELIAIAPDVMKLVKNYVEQGISELPEIVKNIHGLLKDHIDGVTEKDIHDIIAGEYNGKKPTRSQLAQQVFDLRKEASLINELEQLENGQVPASKNKQRQRNQKIEALRSQIKDLKYDMGLNDKTDADKLASLKARYKSQISDLEKKIAAGEYGPDVKPEPIKLDKEAIDLKDKMIKLKLDREARLAKQEYDNRNNIQKAKDLVADVLETSRTVATNPDMSFFGRQGIKYLITHPIKGPQLFWESFRQANSQKRYDRWLYDMHNSGAWKLIEDSGVAVLDPNTLHASKQEEGWRAKLIHKIPAAKSIVKWSERAFTSAANMARADWFMEGANILRKQGKTWENSPEEYKGWASAVNNMTGRGGLGKLEPVVGQLAIPFWSPRLIAANVNLFLNPVYYAKMPKTARLMLIKNMAQYITTGVAFLGLANTLGADTEVDPRSSDFGKIKVGNTRYDIWGGASQYIRVLSQLMTASRKSSGSVSELKPRQMITTGTNLVRTKLSPIWGFMIDAKLGENVVGEKVEWKNAYKLMIPMLWNDIQDAKKDSGPDAAAVAGLLSFLGIGAQTYGAKSAGTGTVNTKRKPTKTTKQTHTKTSK